METGNRAENLMNLGYWRWIYKKFLERAEQDRKKQETKRSSLSVITGTQSDRGPKPSPSWSKINISLNNKAAVSQRQETVIDEAITAYCVSGCTFSPHASLYTLPEPAELTLVAVLRVNGAVTAASTRVAQVPPHWSLEETLTTYSGSWNYSRDKNSD